MMVALAAIVVVALVAGFALLHPLPGSIARTAVGQKMLIARDGRNIAYHALGRGPRVLLAASAGREASDFNELAAALVAAGYRTLAVEAPGIGGTELPQGKWGLYDFAADLKAAVEADAAGDGETIAVAVGHAFGNRVVRAAAARYPETFPAVVLLAAGGKRPVPERAQAALVAGFNPLRTAARRLEDVRYAFFAEGNEPPAYWRRGWHGRTAQLQGRATANTPDQNWLSAGAGPMLVVQAAEDRIAPKEDTADLLLDEFPDRVQVALVEGAGHALLPEQPERISEAVLAFLAAVFPQPPQTSSILEG